LTEEYRYGLMAGKARRGRHAGQRTCCAVWLTLGAMWSSVNTMPSIMPCCIACGVTRHRSRQRRHDAEEKGDINKRADGEGLPEQLHEAEMAGA
jgi:hypothetical protein